MADLRTRVFRAMLRRGATVVVVSAVASAGLIACEEGSSPSKQEETGRPTTAESGSTTRGDNLTNAKGVVHWTCNGDRRVTLTMTDPADGRAVAERTFPVPDGCHPTSELGRAVFDNDFGRMAVGLKDHVGYVDTKTGAVASASKPQSAYTTGSVSNPMFRPRTDEIWYRTSSSTDQRLFSVAAAGGEPVDRGRLDPESEFDFAPNGTLILEPRGHDEASLSPDGKLAFVRFSPDAGSTIKFYRVSEDTLDLTKSPLPIPRPECHDPQAWLDNRTVVLVKYGCTPYDKSRTSSRTGNLVLGTLNEGLDGLTFRDMFPPGPGPIKFSHVSPDGKMILFTTDYTTYKVPVSGPGAGAPLEFSARPISVLEWRG